MILARLDTVTDDRTKYAVPVSELDTEAETDDLIVAAVRVTVGAAVSRVIVAVASDCELGPVFPTKSVAPPAAKRGVIVPAPQFVTVTVRDTPVSVPGAKEQFDAVPAFEKSSQVTPVTLSENVMV
ncbi:MAG: hypothetical protein FGM42_10460 [Ilumatobacteraceae bacterium]|nr:hypothetical protein [Ilumatobacteraceae bacterium]